METRILGRASRIITFKWRRPQMLPLPSPYLFVCPSETIRDQLRWSSLILKTRFTNSGWNSLTVVQPVNSNAQFTRRTRDWEKYLSQRKMFLVPAVQKCNTHVVRRTSLYRTSRVKFKKRRYFTEQSKCAVNPPPTINPLTYEIKFLFYPIPPDFRKVPRLHPFVFLETATCRWRWVWSIGGMTLKGENCSTGWHTSPTATLCTANLTYNGIEPGPPRWESRD